MGRSRGDRQTLLLPLCLPSTSSFLTASQLLGNVCKIHAHAFCKEQVKELWEELHQC